MRYAVDIHAWVLMSNHVHLLCTPQHDGAVSLMMRSVGRRYVQYFNYQYRRSGTLWEGRYKSCLVQAERYLIEVYRYIELNPVRANLVDDPSEFIWSSYQVNALGKTSDLCTPHPEYLMLENINERMSNYRALFSHHGKGEILEEIEVLTGRRLKLKKGRSIGWRKKNDAI